MIKKEAVKILNFSYPFNKHNASAVKYAARMVGRHYDVETKEPEKKEEQIETKQEVEDKKEETSKEGDEKMEVKEEEKKEIKEEKKEDEKKEEVVKKTPSDGIVKGLFTDDEIIAVMEDFLTNDDTLRSEQVKCDNVQCAIRGTNRICLTKLRLLIEHVEYGLIGSPTFRNSPDF